MVLPPETLKLYTTRILLSFGPKESRCECYLLTDWRSEDSQKLSSLLEKVVPEWTAKNRFYFFDLPSVGLEAVSRLNQALLLKPNKSLSEYLKARTFLFSFAQETPVPSFEEMVKRLKEKGIEPAPLDEENFKLASEVAKVTLNNFSLKAAPSLAIYDLKTRNKKIVAFPTPITSVSFEIEPL